MPLPPHLSIRPDATMRLDLAIAAADASLSRRRAKQILDAHRVLVNGRPVSAASRTVSPSDVILVVPEPFELTVVGETDDWIAIDKEHGVAVAPTRDRTRPSLMELLALFLKQRGQPQDLFVVHRLDVGTSGVVLFARSSAAAARLSAAFASGGVDKRYVALVDGVAPEELDLDAPIGRTGTAAFATLPSGRSARTIARRVASSDAVSLDAISLLEIRILTGRTHQIRVHLAGAGHPVVGDRQYGGSEASRMMLHAASLEHPLFGKAEAAVPETFRVSSLSPRAL